VHTGRGAGPAHAAGALAAALWAGGCAGAHAGVEKGPPELLVEVLPRSAEILLDGHPVQRGGGILPAPDAEAEHVLSFRAEGYEPEEQVLPAGSAAGARVGAALRPAGFGGAPIDFEDAPALAEAAEFLVAEGHPEDGEAYAARAVAIAPRAPLAHRALGSARSRLGDPRAAADEWSEYLRLAPGAPDGVQVSRWIEEARRGEVPAGR
jgi:hypothetical protein